MAKKCKKFFIAWGGDCLLKGRFHVKIDIEM